MEMISARDRSTAMMIHLSSLTDFVFPMAGILAPFILWQLKKHEGPFIDGHGKAAVNFNLTLIALQLICGLAIFFMVVGTLTTGAIDSRLFGVALFGGVSGIVVILGFLGVFWLIRLICVVIVAAQGNRGEPAHYPFAIRFVK